MKHLSLAALAALSVVVARPVAAAAAPEPGRLTAADGVAVPGRLYPAAHPKATILLFHQANSSKDEYATIAPRLAEAGYDALAIDQRVGGSLFGHNETAATAKGHPVYDDSLLDLEAAFTWAQRRGRPIALWGSSYSAALVFRLAAAHPGHVAAVLAFSPGEYLIRPPSVAQSAAKVTAPVFVTSASDPAEIAGARTIIDATRSAVKVDYVPRTGVHGSSTLIAKRNPGGASANWAAVSAFLAKALP